MMEFNTTMNPAFIQRIINEHPEATRRGIRQGMFTVGHVLRKKAQRNIIKGPKTGRFYNVPGRSNKHRASAPGEPPANLFGNLQKSVGFNLVGADDMKFGYRETASNGVSVPYGRILELGGTISRPGTKGPGMQVIAPRPNLSKVVAQTEKQAEVYMAKEIEDALVPR